MQGTPGKLLIAALALGIAGCVSSDRAAKVEASIAQVIRIKGMARYSIDQHEWKELKMGMQFKAGILIQTGPKAFVDICMNGGHPGFPQDGSEKTSDHMIRVFENSALRIDNLTKEQSGKQFSENIELDLRAGEILVKVGKVSPESSYLIKMPDELVEVHEGEFMVGGGIISVLKGSVSAVLKNADGSETRVEIGSRHGFDPTTSKVPFILESYTTISFPDSLVCGPSKPASINPSTNSGILHGSGMGGALRQFQ